jgi:hypothetical protein
LLIMACPVTRTITINFNPSTPAPANGYRVRWRTVGSESFIIAGNFNSSPVVLNNIPMCSAIEGTIENSCGNNDYSSSTVWSVPALTSTKCANILVRSKLSPSYYTYPKELLDVDNSASSTISLNYIANDTPNKFIVYNSDSTEVANSGWVGVANYAGPWGSILDTNISGSLTFPKASGDGRFFSLVVEHAGHATITDSWQVTLGCTVGGGGMTPTYDLKAYIYGAQTNVGAEGQTITVVLTTTNVPNGTSLNYEVTGIQAPDLTGASAGLTGSFIVNNGTATKVFVFANDVTTEGVENFLLTLTALGISKSITLPISDTSPGS